MLIYHSAITTTLYVYFSDTEASQACFRLLHDDDDILSCVNVMMVVH